MRSWSSRSGVPESSTHNGVSGSHLAAISASWHDCLIGRTEITKIRYRGTRHGVGMVADGGPVGRLDLFHGRVAHLRNDADRRVFEKRMRDEGVPQGIGAHACGKPDIRGHTTPQVTERAFSPHRPVILK